MTFTQVIISTEIGPIPDDWDLVRLGKLSEFVTSGSRSWAKHYSSHGALFIRSQNVRSGQLDFKDSQFVIPPQGAEGDRTRLKHDDLLITITGNSVGNVAHVNGDLGEAYISQHVGLVRLHEPINANFVCRFLSPGSPGNHQIWARQSGQSKPGLSLADLHELWVAIPPTGPEQRAIVEALSDVDELIGGLDKLIAKKRAIKLATMQQLLTGKIRLPRFSGEWVQRQLGDLASLYQPITISARQFTPSGYPVYGANGVVGFYTAFNHEKWQVTVTCRGSTCGTVNRTVDRCWITGNAMVVNCDHRINVDKEFLYYLMSSRDLSTCITGTGQPQIVRGPLARYELSLPDQMDEQVAIAKILSDMDVEITALEQRRDKSKAIKQGMMQQLLTGRIRLVEPEDTP